MLDVMESESVAVRRRARRGELTTNTSGLAPGFVQGNVAIVPAEFAADFTQYCRLNAQACPVLAVSRPGDPSLPKFIIDKII